MLTNSINEISPSMADMNRPVRHTCPLSRKRSWVAPSLAFGYLHCV